MIRRLLVLSLICVTAIGAKCSGVGTQPDCTPPAKPTFSAKLDAADSISTAAATASVTSGILLKVSGTDSCVADHSFSFNLVTTNTGTFTVGDGSALNAILRIGATNQWVASPGVGGSGSVTLTTFSPNHVVGTFQFMVVPNPGSDASGTHTVSGGTFDVIF